MTDDSPPGGARPRPRGRRPSGAPTREQILQAARSEFAARGYDAASLRGIARAAGVDPALVHHYFDGKSDLFAQSLNMPDDVLARRAVLLSVPREHLGEMVIRSFLTVWDTPGARDAIRAMLRGAVASDDAARPLREFMLHMVLEPLARGTGVPDPQLRATATASQMLGIGILRYVVADTELSECSIEEMVALFAPTVQRYLVDPEL